MKFVEEMKIDIPKVNQIFELGDLTIIIGRSNCGKTRILQHFEGLFKKLNGNWVNSPSYMKLEAKRLGITLSDNVSKKVRSFLISSPREPVSTIGGYSKALSTIEFSCKNIDPSIQEFGTGGVKQNNEHRFLNLQGSGIQNFMQIISKIHESIEIVLIDEPEISQFPTGKVEILKQLPNLLREKQVIITTHDPTIINQYLLKKILGKDKYNVKIYSFCENDIFKKINYENNTDVDINCNYLNQTISGKPIHLFLEGETELYLFPALINKYCLKNSLPDFPKIMNRINISFFGGQRWETGVFHLPPPEFYDVLVILDNEHKEKVNKLLKSDFKIISSFSEYEFNKVNIFCLDSNGIEESFKNIFPTSSFSKGCSLASEVWRTSEDIIEKLRGSSEKSKQIYEIIEFIVNKAKNNKLT